MTTEQVVFTKQEEAMIKAFSKEERASFDAIPTDAERKSMLMLMAGIMGSANAGVEIEEVKATGEEQDPILAPSGLGLKAGTTITARLLGTVPMFSTEPKENWEEKTIEGRLVFVNHYYRFEDLNTGSTFGIYKSPMLNKVLTKLPTKASNKNVASNPIVSLRYEGKIEDKEVLKTKYGFDLQKGTSAHAFVVGLEKGLTYDAYRRGIVNYLKSPIPNFGEKELVDDLTLAQRNWNSLERLNGNVGEVGQDVAGQAQLSM